MRFRPSKHPDIRKWVALPEIDEEAKCRFWRKVSVGEQSDCWPWMGGATLRGYGRFKVAGRLYSSHRVAYVITKGAIPPLRSYHGAVVMHSCDNPSCCNPAHLEIGSQRQNARDMSKRGRSLAGKPRSPNYGASRSPDTLPSGQNRSQGRA